MAEARKPARARPMPTESSEQIKTVLKFSMFYPKEAQLLIAVPNGSYRKPLEAIRLKREGVKVGMTDLMLLMARGGFHGFCLELKRADGGVVSVAQKKMHGLLAEQGYMVKICSGADEAYTALEQYVAMHN